MPKEKAKPRATKKRNKKNTQKENEEQRSVAASDATAPVNSTSSINESGNAVGHQAMYTILSNAQLNETFHKRYTKELKQLYSKLDHEAFMHTFIEMFKTVLAAEEGNEYGTTALAFCAKFVTSFEEETTHPILAETFRWLLSTISSSTLIRYRICFFVNLILKHLGPCAALDDSQCDQILQYMLERLKDVSPGVRKEAVLAIQRLQVPDQTDDPVVCAYLYHLSSDPSPAVRQCIISCMGRNCLTVPHILQRLSDVDEKVRRHTYINMCTYPVRSFKVSQRLTLLECGLNDRSDTVRKNVIKYMLKAWQEAYQHNYIALTSALKLDSNEEELMRFRKVARQMLLVIFEQNEPRELLELLPLSEDCELHRCIPQEALTVELVLYWQVLSEYLQEQQADEFELVLPELSVFCDYIKKFCQFQVPDMDKFAQLEFQGMLLSLVEILRTYDLGDEIGRNNLRELITHLLKECQLEHKIVFVLVRCVEQLMPDMHSYMQYFIDITYEICELNKKQNDLVHDRSLMDKLLVGQDTALVMRINSLKVKILELEEQEENFVRQKEYIRAKAVSDERNVVTEEYTELVRPLYEQHGELNLPSRPKLSKQERVLKGLYIVFYMVTSKQVQSLNPSLCKLYKDFICRHLASTEMDICEWAIKCGTTFSLLYEPYIKEVSDVIVDQFYKDNNLRLLETAAHCILELIDHYGVDYFADLNSNTGNSLGQAPKNKRRLLYTMQDFFDGEDDRSQSSSDQSTDIIGMLGVYVEKVDCKGILLVIVRGLCRLVLRGHLNNRLDVMEKLLKRYFNPKTEAIVNQVLGMFFETIVAQRQQSMLVPSLLPIVWSVMNCTYDSPLHDVQPDHVTKFFIDLTVQDSSPPQTHLHNRIALSFLNYIENYFTERKEMCRLLAKELTTLRLNVQQCPALKNEMQELAEKLLQSELEPRMIRNITDFQGLLNGSFNPPPKKTTEEGQESDAEAEECESVAATTISTAECAAPADIEPTPTAVETVAELKEGPAVVEKPAEPVLTTFGADNQVGLRFLRRSLHNSISNSDAESVCSAHSPARELEKEREKANELSRRNLRRPEMQQRIEQAIARASKTPEKPSEPAEESTVIQCEDDSDKTSTNKTLTNATLTKKTPIKKTPTNKPPTSVGVSTPAYKTPINTTQEQCDDSEIIEATPTPPRNSTLNATRLQASRSRLRSLRQRNTSGVGAAAGTSTGNGNGSKRKVLHTPLRNGTKRVLRKSVHATPSASPRISPLRKQLRLEHKTPRTSRVVRSAASTIAVPPSDKHTASPTDSSSSSVKENTAPSPAAKTSRKSTPKARQVPRIVISSPMERVTTRLSAKKQRISSTLMTRKRMSLELSLTEGHPKETTPKRLCPGSGRSSRRRN
ncbi:Cap-G [Drosophila busckii]|uniref:Cap-G n=1 Tax=Drosophila busckii TaxID=30019 RepID=A0A0M3QUJ8_DROBS|nr:condensin complex subunit 3 [Drosophila busckii]ALC40799.1 Cap-G [Drosophila busckii]